MLVIEQNAKHRYDSFELSAVHAIGQDALPKARVTHERFGSRLRDSAQPFPHRAAPPIARLARLPQQPRKIPAGLDQLVVRVLPAADPHNPDNPGCEQELNRVPHVVCAHP